MRGRVGILSAETARDIGIVRAQQFDGVFVQDDGTVHVDYSGADASVTIALLDAG